MAYFAISPSLSAAACWACCVGKELIVICQTVLDFLFLFSLPSDASQLQCYGCFMRVQYTTTTGSLEGCKRTKKCAPSFLKWWTQWLQKHVGVVPEAVPRGKGGVTRGTQGTQGTTGE